MLALRSSPSIRQARPTLPGGVPRAGEARGRRPRTARRQIRPCPLPRGEKCPPSASATSPGPLGPYGPATRFTSRSSGRIAPASNAGRPARHAAVARPRFTDLWSGPRLVSVPSVDIDPAKAAALAVSPAAISSSISRSSGRRGPGSLNCFGRTLPIWFEVHSGARHRYPCVRTPRGPQQQGHDGARPFGCHASPGACADRLERIDLLPAVSITASLAGGLSLAERDSSASTWPRRSSRRTARRTID